MKLWKKNCTIDSKIEAYTVGKDYLLDQKLVPFDCQASKAHAQMLCKAGILTGEELSQLTRCLDEIVALWKDGLFSIHRQDEDCHTAIELYLTNKLGETGKKIHTARSRNDQVLTALRLFEKSELHQILDLLAEYVSSLKSLGEKEKNIPMPGYTHMQRAMPTDIATWIGAFISAAHDMEHLTLSVLRMIDQSPLGSAAGFGVPVFDIDRTMTAQLMGFASVMENPIYCQMSRGKFESAIVHLLTQIMYDLNKIATDLILFNMKEFLFVSLPSELCTGSSIMPQKKNPDVLELVRGSYHIVLGEQFKISSLIANLMSGYNRDLQLTKEPLFNSLDIVKDSLEIMIHTLPLISFNREALENAITEELYATQKAYELVKKGVSFREAYKEIGKQFDKS